MSRRSEPRVGRPLSSRSTRMDALTDRKKILKDALATIEDLQSRLKMAEGAQKEPIAIVGMSFTLSGRRRRHRKILGASPWRRRCHSRGAARSLEHRQLL